jgi:hypothetical protein
VNTIKSLTLEGELKVLGTCGRHNRDIFNTTILHMYTLAGFDLATQSCSLLGGRRRRYLYVCRPRRQGVIKFLKISTSTLYAVGIRSRELYIHMLTPFSDSIRRLNHKIAPTEQFFIIWDRCYDFLNIFAEKFSRKKWRF